MKERVDEITTMRGFAMFGIVLLHVTSYTLGAAAPSSLAFKAGLTLNQFVRFSLPLFLVISGFALAYNYDRAKGISYKEFIFKRIKAIFGPYLFWSLAYFLFYVAVLRRIPLGVKVVGLDSVTLDMFSVITVFLKNLVFGWNYVHLYFIILIFQFYLLYPLVIRRFAESRLPGPILAAGAAVYVGLLVYLFYFRKATGIYFFDLFVRYYWQTFIAWYFYFLLGMAAGLYFQEFRSLAGRSFPMVIALYLAGSILVIAEAFLYGPAQVARLTSLRVTVLLNTIPAVFFYFRLGRILEKALPAIFRFFQDLGRKSFGVYFVHLLVLAEIPGLLNRIWPAFFNFNRASFTLIVFVLTLICSMVLVRIICAVPYGYLIIGGKSNKQAVSPSTANRTGNSC